MDRAYDIVYDKFFRPFEGKTTAGRIGAELEFPLVKIGGGDIDPAYAAGITEHFLARGWRVAWAANHCLLKTGPVTVSASTTHTTILSFPSTTATA